MTMIPHTGKADMGGKKSVRIPVVFLAVFLVWFMAIGWVVTYTKIYNVKSFACLINGDWEGASSRRTQIEQAQQGDANAQYGLGIFYASQVCAPSSEENFRKGLEWLEKAALSESEFGDNWIHKIVVFYGYARLHEETKFRLSAEQLVERAVQEFGAEFKLDWPMIQCRRGELEWSECRDTMKAAAKAGSFIGQIYYAEILAEGLGGGIDRAESERIINELIIKNSDGGLSKTARMNSLIRQKNKMDFE